MLTTTLNLNKRVLVVDAPQGSYDHKIEKFQNYFQFNCQLSENESIGFAFFYKDFGGKKKYPNDIKFLCKGEDITEEIAEQLIKVGDEGFECWNYKNNKWGAFGFSPIESFISEIEANGFYWLVNPYEDYKAQTVEHYKEWEELFQEAESKTFKNPLIFEIL